MKILWILILSLTCTFGQNVKVDYSSCQEVSDLLKYMKNRATKSGAEEKIDKLLNHKSYSALFTFYKNNSSERISKDIFKRMILNLQWPGTYKKGENRTADFMLYKWNQVYNNLPHLQHKIKQLQKINLSLIITNSIRRANEWLPSGMKTETFNFIVTADGKNAGYKINNHQVYDIFQIPIDMRGNIDVNLFSEIIAHESHHSGLNVRGNNKYNMKEKLLLHFLTVFIAEGTATKLVNNVYGKYVPKINPDNSTDYFKVIPGVNIERSWRNMFPEEPEMFKRFFDTVEKIMSGKFKENEIQRELNLYWMSPGSAKYYLLGSELIGAIYFGFGKTGCFEVMQDPVKLLPMYDQAVAKNRYILKECPRVPKELLKYFM